MLSFFSSPLETGMAKDQAQRFILSSFSSLRSLCERWEFQHEQGKEVIIEMANLCRRLLKKDEKKKKDLVERLSDRWSMLQKNIQRLTHIYHQINSLKECLITFQDQQCESGNNCVQQFVFASLSLSHYVIYFDQISSRYRQELVVKHLIEEELKLTVYHYLPSNDVKVSHPFHSFLMPNTKEDQKWEVHIASWAAQAFLDIPSLSHILSILDADTEAEGI